MDTIDIKKPKQPRHEIHRWVCTKGCFKWFLNVDNLDPISRMKLEYYSTQVTLHVLKFKHEVTHVQKDPPNIRRI